MNLRKIKSLGYSGKQEFTTDIGEKGFVNTLSVNLGKQYVHQGGAMVAGMWTGAFLVPQNQFSKIDYAKLRKSEATCFEVSLKSYFIIVSED